MNHSKLRKAIGDCLRDEISLEGERICVVDTCCRDGLLLRELFQELSNRGGRSQASIEIVAILPHESERDATAANLEGIPHTLIGGDVQNPEQWLPELSRDNRATRFLYVLESTQGKSAKDWLQLGEAWSRVLNGKSDRLIAAVPHQPRDAVTVMQQVSGEAPDEEFIDAEAFLILMAKVGLIPKTQPVSFPAAQSVCRASVSQFEKWDCSIRHAKPDDLSALDRLEKLCWAPKLQTRASSLARRIEDYPEGQFVLELEGNVVGVIYSQRINNVGDIEQIDCETVYRIHDRDGSIIQLLAVNMDPVVQQRKLGDLLLEFMLQRCSVTAGIEQVVAVSLCRDFHKQNDLSFDQYIHHRDANKLIADPILRFHELHGAKIVKPVPQYRRKDVNNRGHGVLVQYEIHHRRRVAQHCDSASAKPIDRLPGEAKGREIAAAEIENYFVEFLKKQLGPDRLEAWAENRPFMEMGLDSMDMMDLTEAVSVKFSHPEDASFYFQYDTCEKLVAYFTEKLAVSELPVKKKASPAVEIVSNIPSSGQADLNQSDIAIIGMSCRLPMDINTPAVFWDFLKDGGSAIGPLPEGRWYWPKDVDPKGNYQGIDRGGFISDIARFDASFFRLTPKAVELMDPQQRLLLELSWEALDDSSWAAQQLAGSNTGVFVGASGYDYRLLLEQHQVPAEAHLGTGSSMAVLANGLSYFYDFHGPSMNIDTACSSSLVALHMAIRSLRSGDCDQALVGGVNLICHPGSSLSYYKAGMLSADSRCKTFDAAADGYVRSEGGVMIFIKPLEQAIQDKDPIHALIKGTACNHGGGGGGITVPNPEQQAKLIQEAWRDAGVGAETISYVEAHGTGTKLGDPIEVRGLKLAFEEQSADLVPDSCAVGAVKTNVGHLEAAAGITGLLKVVLSLKHRVLAPSINFNSLNPHIDLSKSPFYLLHETKPWETLAQAAGTPRRAGVSSFGSGGVNAHAVLEEYVREECLAGATDQWPLIVLSAKNEERLRAYAGRLAAHLNQEVETGTTLEQWAYTLQRRQPMEERVAFVAEDLVSLREKLHRVAAGKSVDGGWRGNTENSQEIVELFEGTRDLRELVGTWLAKGDVEKIANVWVRGVNVAGWEQLYREIPDRIRLPAYPFAQTRYWFESANAQKPGSSNAAGDEKTATSVRPSPSDALAQGPESGETPLVIIAGAGLFGLCMGVQLKRAGIPFKILEKNQDVGGVWLVNQWPGCGCDIPMLAYGYSFEQYKGDLWAKQPDILKYLQSVAEKYGLYDHIQFNTRIIQAKYQDDEGEWELMLNDGSSASVKYFINAGNEGLGHTRKMPELPGAKDFEGLLQHAVDCKADEIDFNGKRVAIIGNGTTQIQLVEALQPVVNRLVVYARTPKYIYPRARYSPATVAKLNNDSEYWLAQRAEYLRGADRFYHVLNDPVKINPFHNEGEVEQYFNRMIDEDWKSFYAWLEEIEMAPSYAPGCSRPCMSHTYHNQIRAQNVLLETAPVEQITPTGIQTQNGEERFDIILFATGYDLNGFKPFFPIVGKNQFDLEVHYQRFPQSFAGCCFTNFPNLFFGAGPNTGTNATSITAMYEIRCEYFTELIQYCEANRVKSIEIKEAEVDRFVQFVQRENTTGSFQSGCSAWYQTKDGENAAIFPGNLEKFRAWHQFSPDQYRFEYVNDPSVVPNPAAIAAPIIVEEVSKATPHEDIDTVRITEEVLALYAEVTGFGLSELTLDGAISKHGIDSIILVELAARLNQQFKVSLEAVQLFELPTLGDVVDLLGKILLEAGAEAYTRGEALPELATELSEPSTESDSQRPVHSLARNGSAPTASGKTPTKNGAVAIVGISGIFPKASNLEDFWTNICEGVDCITQIPPDRWDWEEVFGDPLEGDYTNVKWGGFIDDVDVFDPAFFNLSPREAALMDPQHRLYLQCVYQAIEYSGHSPAELRGKRIAVYYSANTNDYCNIVQQRLKQTPAIAMQSKWHMFAPSRISYLLGLTGPCQVIDTACSSSGVSIHAAVNAIVHDGCEGAIVGATNLMLLPELHKTYSKAGMISEDGRCRTFADDASGYARGEGVGVVYLKPLPKAEADGDTILGVIRGIEENHGGTSQSLTVPNVKAQAELIEAVLENSGVDPRQVGLVECHGTGTLLGDPVEVSALRQAFEAAYKSAKAAGSFTDKRTGVGSVKSNIGHTEPLAGLAGLFKIVFSLRDQILPPTLHVNRVNPLVKIEESPFYILNEKQSWPRPEIEGKALPRMAALSSFGVGNTNIHLLVEEYPVDEEGPTNAKPNALILSGKDKDRLKAYASAVIQYLQLHQEVDLQRFCLTFQIGREAMKERLAIVFANREELVRDLTKYVAGERVTDRLFEGAVARQGLEEPKQGIGSRIDSIEDFKSLAAKWVKGSSIDWQQIYDHRDIKRLNGLPTYPFAKQRHWLEADKQRFASKVGPQRQPLVPSVPMAKSTVRLEPLPSSARAFTAQPLEKPIVRLSDPEIPRRGPEESSMASSVSLVEYADGILGIVVDDGDQNRWSKGLLQALGQRFESIGRREDTRAVLLRGNDACFISGSWESKGQAAAGQRLPFISDCPVPVIAVVKGRCSEAGWLLAGECDFVVTSQENAVSEHLEDGLGIRVVANDDLDRCAFELGGCFSDKSPLALDLLKQHLTASQPKGFRGALAFDHWKQASPQAFKTNGSAARNDGVLERIDIGSEAVFLERHPNEVVVIRMEDRSSKNLFSEAFVEGVKLAFDHLANNQTYKVAVLTGYEQYFCTGGSKERLLAIQQGESKYSDAPLYEYPLACDIPVIAAMQGHALGAGWALGLFCDICIHSNESVYATNFMEFGFTPGFGSTLILPEKLGKALGWEALFTANEYKGGALKQRGVGLPVLPRAEVLDHALQLANRMAAASRSELIAAKHQGCRKLRERLPQFVEKELEMHRQTFVGNAETLKKIKALFREGMSGRDTAQERSPCTTTVSLDVARIHQQLTELLATELFLDASSIDENMPFVEMGLDSITGVMWIRKVNKAFGISLAASKVYSHPTLAEFVDYVAGEVSGSDGAQPKSVSSTERKESPVVQPVTVPTTLADGSIETLRFRLKRLLADELFLEESEIDGEQPFTEMGLDSVTGVMWVRKLNKAFGLSIEATKVYSHPTLNAFTDYVWETGQVSEGLNAPADLMDSPSLPEVPLDAGHLVVESSRNSERNDTDIAIIGMSGQFPQAATLDAFWHNLKSGKDCISEIPANRWEIDHYFDPNPQTPGKTNSRWMGALEEVAQFDPGFFGLSPAEAEVMDPQQRLLVQNSWHCLEDAGYRPSKLSGSKCGVFVGCGSSDYGRLTEDEDLSAQGLVGSQLSILAARISYLLNLDGPCLAIDTACSSSLVSIAAACDSLVLKNSNLALAGGSWIMAGPSMHIMTSKAGMLSEDGRCYAFDQRANGFVPGEGVGVVCLKRLDDAVTDGDRIHAVIKGWGINQDGKTNGITAPNPDSQTSLQKAVYDRFGIDPANIQMMEAHGTGTKLGDPIEVEALSASFGEYTANKNFCAIGSVKSNIGHLLTAAGVAGLIKVLLSLRHKTIPPTINFNSLNEHIELNQSPFYVNRENQRWTVAEGGKRTAAISSFGFGGTNAHLVVEEFPAELASGNNGKLSVGPVAIVLSGKDEDRLHAYAQKALTFAEQHPDTDVAALAYTLQVGREAMEHRLGFVAVDMVDVVKQLRAFLEGTSDVYLGRSSKKQNQAPHPTAPQEVWYGERNYPAILQAWTNGAQVEWERLYPGAHPPIITAPTYPFAREPYWKHPESQRRGTGKPAREAVQQSTALHPLLHRNTSTFGEQRFSSTFVPEAFFLKDHRVHQRSVLPGAVMLEMADGALRLSGESEADRVVLFGNVVWLQPIAVESATEVHVVLGADDGGTVAFEIIAGGNDCEAESRVCCQGSLVTAERVAADTPDLAAAQDRCHRNRHRLDAKEIYASFHRIGIEYGGACQGLQTVHLGVNEALAEIALPGPQTGPLNRYTLHPTILDAALQVPVVMSWQGGLDQGTLVPFALESLEVRHSCTAKMRAWVRPSSTSSRGDHDIRKFDIDLYDESGKLCVVIKGFSSRVIDPKDGLGQEDIGTFLLQSDWERQDVSERPWKANNRTVFLYGLSETAADFYAADPKNRYLRLNSPAGREPEKLEQIVWEVFRFVQETLSHMPSNEVQCQILMRAGKDETLQSTLSTLFKTTRLENPAFCGQVIAVEDRLNLSQKLDLLRTAFRPGITHVRQGEDNRLETPILRPLDAVSPIEEAIWKHQGVYLITGGAGGLGLAFAKEIVSRVKTVTLVLTGRSALSAEKQQRLQGLRDVGATVDYHRTNVADEEAVRILVKNIKAKYGQINGVIHSAGVIRDEFIIKKSREAFAAVVAPKMTGLWYLDQATQSLCELDFFCAFSSVAGVTGNAGQADYAVANAWMDAYLRERQIKVDAGDRFGRSVSINWPLWEEGGMGLEPSAAEVLRLNTGMMPMKTSLGVGAFYQALFAPRSQVIVAHGEVRQLAIHFGPTQIDRDVAEEGKAGDSDRKVTANPTSTETDEPELKRAAVSYFRQRFASILKFPTEKMDAEVGLEEYGIDSIMVMQLTYDLEQTFGRLSKTLFFEYQTIEELSQYFLRAHREPLLAELSPAQEVKVFGADIGLGQATRNKGEHQSEWRGDRSQGREPASNRAALDIAIVGLSGRYPQAGDLNAYWANLKAGKNCVTEVPETRWDWKAYYSEDRMKDGAHFSKYGGFIEDVDKFDALFFNISPRDAELMDPQERLFLEHAWMALEDAGCRPEDLDRDGGLGRQVGVYAGVMYNDYGLLGYDAARRGEPVPVGSLHASIANRVSYFLNLHGPSMSVDTMCSSSLTALHLACQDLKTGQTHLAIAGGVNVSIHPNKYTLLSAGQFISNRGACESFGEGGSGYIPGEGVGVAILKRLADAERDGDRIYGVITGSGINHGGKTNGVNVPNPKAQTAVIQRAMKEAKISPRDISYIEAHGTGTKLGDPIEIAALDKIYGGDSQHCWIGSAKSNIGHCESAAGIAGLTKVLLQMQHRQIAPSLHSTVLNPNIDFSAVPFEVNQQLRDWQPVGGDESPQHLRAGVSSFGAGGSNGHLIIESYPDQAKEDLTVSDHQPVLFVLSAKNDDRLAAYAQKLASFLEEHPDINLTNLSYTLQVGRAAMDQRLAFTAGSREEALEKLTAFGHGTTADVYTGNSRELKSKDGIAPDQLVDVAACVQSKNYALLLGLWSKGLPVDWRRLYERRRPRIISAPTYPFAKTSYWVGQTGQPIDFSPNLSLAAKQAFPSLGKNGHGLDARTKTGATIPNQARNGSKPIKRQSPQIVEDIPQYLAIEECWLPQPLDIDPDGWLGRIEAKNDFELLVISDQRADFEQIRQAAQVVDKLAHQEGFLGQMDHLDLNASGDFGQYEAMLKAKLSGSSAPLAVFLCLPAGGGSLEESVAVFSWVQSLVRTAFSRTVQCYCLYPESHSEGSIYREGLSGFFKSAMLECVDHRYRSIAVDESWKASFGLKALQEWLCDETCHLDPQETPMVRYVEGGRQALLVRETSREALAESPTIFKEQGTYLVLGALGGVGEMVCTELGRRFGAKLVLFSRRPEKAALPVIRKIEAAGGTVVYRSVDITDREALTHTVSALQADGIAFNGVFQMARSITEGSIANKDFPACVAEVANKVQGTMNLDAVLTNESLDFFFNFSSMASFGSKGLSDYAYATAFQNAMARYRNRQAMNHPRMGHCASICWGPWGVDHAFSEDKLESLRAHWRGMGLAFVEVERAVDFMNGVVSGAFDTAGLCATEDRLTAIASLGFTHAIQIGEREVAAKLESFRRQELSEGEFAQFLKGITHNGNFRSIPDHLVQAVEHTLRAQSNGDSQGALPDETSDERREKTPLQVIKESAERVLKIPEGVIETDVSLQDYGLDSITAMQLAATLEKAFHISFQLDWLIEHPTVDELAAKLTEVAY